MVHVLSKISAVWHVTHEKQFYEFLLHLTLRLQQQSSATKHAPGVVPEATQADIPQQSQAHNERADEREGERTDERADKMAEAQIDQQRDATIDVAVQPLNKEVIANTQPIVMEQRYNKANKVSRFKKGMDC
ncbi:hypothetical protein BDD12DRAFT_903409 [Trichophaea hybrida]|nr:hypothetical protein BDD12DRAFT_903409 [Trichophaea hybrida]